MGGLAGQPQTTFIVLLVNTAIRFLWLHVVVMKIHKQATQRLEHVIDRVPHLPGWAPVMVVRGESAER